MRLLILSLLCFGMTSYAITPAQQQSLEKWATQKQEELFKDCGKITRSEWLKRYDDVELAYVEKIEEVGDAGIKDRKALPEFWSLGKVVYPHDLPKAYPMKGAYLSCFDDFNEFKDARNRAEAIDARKKLEACSEAAYREEVPAILTRQLGCLRSLKE